MVRAFVRSDMERVLDIWLKASIKAHNFIEEKFWESKLGEMRDVYLASSEIYVYEDGGRVEGFLALCGNTVAALFVSPVCQGRGIGGCLMDKAKEVRDGLCLAVYKENVSSIRFYERHGFRVLEERVDGHTGHMELLMAFDV
ncbi:MAG: GNAT family N-acetyltransferase [Candidatus Omnitrophica bacterium]|nr:GNAT family N-acetyltransferase [Candidatus Omnitrophota bacterium]MDD5488510.1 GNAT family N-acetyltransferase [Candidatus Omnitrophota bacterium]